MPTTTTTGPTTGADTRRVERRGRRLRRWLGSPRRRAVVALVAVVAMLLTPVPWRHHLGDDPMGLAWRLDGQLTVEGQAIDPPGRWTWLTVGRPPLVAEVIYEQVMPGQDSYDMRDAPTTYDPGLVEPTAAAVGLQAAGYDVTLGVRTEVSEPVDERYPAEGVIVAVNGVELVDREAWEQVTVPSGGPITFELAGGEVHEFEGPTLPYHRVRVLDVPPEGLSAMMFGWLPDIGVVRWARSLALGPSHGLMVALTTYANAVDEDLAQGRHIAGTGGIRGDGVVTPIGGLPSKARAAKRAGADVLLYPASQAHQLAGFDAGNMRLVPVRTLGDAIEALGHVDELLPVPSPEGEPEAFTADGDLEEAVADEEAEGEDAFADADEVEAAPPVPAEPDA